MAILAGDLKLLQSETMSDAPESGGNISSRVIIDGLSNNIFDDISQLARTYGAVRLRKIFAKVDSAADERLYGSHVIISRLPKDKQLGVNLFKTGSSHDLRPYAANRIENYRAQGARYTGYLYGMQYKGARTLTIFQSLDSPVLVIGEVIMLAKKNNIDPQFLRITAVNSTVQTFNDGKDNFTRRVVNCELSSYLAFDYGGLEVNKSDTNEPPTYIYRTIVANAARYYSARPLRMDAHLGDFTLNVDSVYSQVVPSSQSAIPLIDLSAGSNVLPLVDLGSGLSTLIADSFPANGAFYTVSGDVFIGAFFPDSLVVTTASGNVTASNGNLVQNGVTMGYYNAVSGVLHFSSPIQSIDFKWRSAVAPLIISDTYSLKVTDLNRSFVYADNINPPPAANTLSVSFMAMANRYELRDNGMGQLVSVDGVGSGSVNYVTGSVSVAFAALPDIGSEIVYSWGKTVDFENVADTPIRASFNKKLSNTGVETSSLLVTWQINGEQKTLTTANNGVMSGDGTGFFNGTLGIVDFVPADITPIGTVFNFEYLYGLGAMGKITLPINTFNRVGDVISADVGMTNILPNSVVVEWQVPWGTSTAHNGAWETAGYIELPRVSSGMITHQFHDNGVGGFSDGGGRGFSFDYANGLMSLDVAEVPFLVKFPYFNKEMLGIRSSFRGYLDLPVEFGLAGGLTIHCRTYTNMPNNVVGYDTLQVGSVMSVDLTPKGGSDPLVPKSVAFEFAGRRYQDRSGQLYYNINPATGAGVFGGTLDYATGVAAISQWGSGINAGILVSAMTSSGFNPIDKITFYTSIAPIKPSSFSVRAAKSNGGFVSATSNDAGIIATADMFGSVDLATGVVKLHFGQMVTASGNEAQPWYALENVVDGMIFKPKPVLASTVVYNAVSFTYIPLEPEILGLDPVRLPMDGRIPIYSRGDVVVVLNDQVTTGTFVSGSVTDLGRNRLAKVTVKDLGGTLLDSTCYAVDLDAGVITWLNLAGISQPLKIIDRIEDMAVVSDIQVTGKLTLSRPLSHNFPAQTTLVANAVILGDLFARTSIPFDQKTWSGVWNDELVGEATNAQFNQTLYPIETFNDSTIEERWLLIFTTAKAFNVIGERTGLIATGNIDTDFAPINPAYNAPYFSITHRAFGLGWSAGNVLRFNTYSASAPLWIVQSIGQGDPTDSDYGFCVEFRGDVNAP